MSIFILRNDFLFLKCSAFIGNSSFPAFPEGFSTTFFDLKNAKNRSTVLSISKKLKSISGFFFYYTSINYPIQPE
jgi:hypothetical protein